MSKQDDFLRSPQAAQFLNNKAHVQQMLQSPDVQHLMQLLQKGGANGLQAAAQSARQGDPAALVRLVEQVMSSPDGARTVQKINNAMGK